MAISEFEIKRLEKIVGAFIEKRRPPPSIRKELDLGFRIEGQSAELFEIRPAWQKPGEYRQNPFAKATFVKSQGIWKIYWQRADLKWHSYQPNPVVKTIEEFLAVVERDEYGCFFG